MQPTDLPALIAEHFDFRDYVDDAATLDSLKVEQQRSLAAAYLRTNPTDFAEFTAYLSEQDHVVEALADIIGGEADGDAMLEFAKVAGDAAIAAFRDGIDDQIENARCEFLRDHGQFSSDSLHGPGEFERFREAG